jgi:cytochrome c oxidase subunit 1
MLHYMFPLITGRMYNEKLGMISFWLLFVGSTVMFMTMHVEGLYGQPRRTFDYVPVQPLIIMNQIATVGAFINGIGASVLIANMIGSSAKGKPADIKDPFKIGEVYYDHTRKEPHH